MKWFKHSALASLQTPIRSIKEKYGYAGLGIFWCIVEAVYLNEGQLTIGEIKRMFWNKHFTKTKIEDILMGFGCFKFDTMSRVSLSEDSPSVSPNVSPSVSPSVNARTIILRLEKIKKKTKTIIKGRRRRLLVR